MSHRSPQPSERAPVPAVRAVPVPRPAAALLLVLLATAWLGAARAQEAVAPEPPRDEVVVAGRGLVHGEPDQATVSLGVEATDPEARAAIDATTAAMERVREALARAGVEDRDVRTVTFDLHAETPHDPEGRMLPERFRLVHLVEVTVRDVDAVGEILASAVEAGANRVGGIAFGIADPAPLEAEARRAAVEDASEKAAQLAEAAGRSLGGALQIAETGAAPPPRGEIGGRMMALEAASVPVASGRLAVEVHVSMVFALE